MSFFAVDVDGCMNVLAQAEGIAELRNRAVQAVSTAKSTGPRGAHAGRHRIDKIAVGNTHITTQGPIVDIDWPDSFWHFVEFGSVNNPPYAPIRNAAQQAGLDVIDERSAG